MPEPDSLKADADFTSATYRIAAQDVLEITVFGFPTLSRTVQVDGSGRVSYPLIGVVTAAGRTLNEFEAELAKKLGDRFLRSPQVSVLVKESVGLRVTVEGAARRPGVYQLKGKTTLLQALAMAEGINDVGDYTVSLMRVSGQRRITAKYDVSAIRTGQADDPLVYGGDTIVIEESAARTGLQMFKTTVPTLLNVGARAW
ncbi:MULTISPECIES: polysaccharide biosynthesis/export family protein [Methylosinus]|uniref:polysaccharide biosynthesis/export family protein n=1 Tax=Methylosinus TaxID=425 RepID=UPI00068475D9|nr:MULTISPECIES: polysaccharide biosynthesis/export family protein [Methylosinus]OBS50483.1 sugar transporter [Methylosinus sp. 3S-1]